MGNALFVQVPYSAEHIAHELRSMCLSCDERRRDEMRCKERRCEVTREKMWWDGRRKKWRGEGDKVWRKKLGTKKREEGGGVIDDRTKSIRRTHAHTHCTHKHTTFTTTHTLHAHTHTSPNPLWALCVISSNSSPPWHSSMTRYTVLDPKNTSLSLMMLGWSTSCKGRGGKERGEW